jgi:uncharacterized protein (DUF302 family)
MVEYAPSTESPASIVQLPPTPTVALDLPLRVFVREGASGNTIVAYYPADTITDATILIEEQLARSSKAELLIAKTVSGE